MPLFFLGGAHGVGKTTLAGPLSIRLHAKAVTAGQLIREEGAEPYSADKRVTDISGNQDRLLRALARYRASDTTLLLDGHYCILSTRGAPVAISADVFRAMAPDALLLLEDDASAVAERLSARDRVRHTVADVKSLIECERTAAQLISAELELPLCLLHAANGVERAFAFLTPSQA